MALFEESLGGVIAGAVVVGAVSLAAPIVLPVLVNVGRPLIKNAIKGAILAFGRGQELFGEMSETLEDLTAEARAEMGNGHGRAAARPRARSRGNGRKRSATRTRRTRAASESAAAAA
jgi:hypothetical protein